MLASTQPSASLLRAAPLANRTVAASGAPGCALPSLARNAQGLGVPQARADLWDRAVEYGASSHGSGRRAGGARVVARAEKEPGTSREDSYQPFPFDTLDYVKCSLAVVQTTDLSAGSPKGNLILMKSGKRPGGDPSDLALNIQVGGDTLWAIAAMLQGHVDRPFTLDLMWSLLMRGREISGSGWTLLHVAVVEVRGSVFVGRLFFGDPGTGRVAYDCDVRPSDGCWMALKARCPIYVHHGIWDSCAVPATSLAPGREVDGDDGLQTESISAWEDTETMMKRIRMSDPDAIKRLKREMEVAVAEEDYKTAARIRDHPYMQLYMRIVEHRKAGNDALADKLEDELFKIIHANDSGSESDTEDGF